MAVTIEAKAAVMALVGAVVQVTIPDEVVEALAQMLIAGNSGGVSEVVKLGVGVGARAMAREMARQEKTKVPK